ACVGIPSLPVPLRPLLSSCRRSSSFCARPTPTTGIYTLSLHDALPILPPTLVPAAMALATIVGMGAAYAPASRAARRPRPCRRRSEEHTSELQSRENLVCRLLLEKKKSKWEPES